MLDEHLTCPKCGYDLYGIPEVRCPECDFRYDAAALRSTAASAEWLRLITARTVIVRSAVASALVMPFVVRAVPIGPIGWFHIVVVVDIAAFVTWLGFRDAYRGPASIPSLLMLLVGICLGMMFVLRHFPWVLPVIALLVLASVWVARLSDWPKLHPAGNAPSTELRRSVIRHSIAGNVLLVVASLLVAVSLLRLGAV